MVPSRVDSDPFRRRGSPVFRGTPPPPYMPSKKEAAIELTKTFGPLALALGFSGAVFGGDYYLLSKAQSNQPLSNMTLVSRTFGALEGRVNAELMGRGLGDHDLDK